MSPTSAPFEPTDPTAPDPPRPPVQRTVGRWITLRPIRPADYDFVRTAELSDDLGLRWRHRGATPSPESFAHTLWAGVLTQYLVVANADHRVLGLVSAYDADLRAGTCFVGFARFDPLDRSLGMIEAIILLTEHLFAHWPFRKLYGEAVEFNLADFGALLDGLLVEEGRLREHVFVGGRHWDLSYLALYRENWLANRDRLLPPWLDADGVAAPAPGPGSRLTVSIPGRPA